MSTQKEAAACEEANFQKTCPICGNEEIQEKDNYCFICGKKLKENPNIIDFHP